MGHDTAAHRKEYIRVFWYLVVLTVVEVVLPNFTDSLGKPMVLAGLMSLAFAKAGCVGYYYMHLKSDTRFLQWTIIIPMLLPFFYAAILIAEGIWRYLR